MHTLFLFAFFAMISYLCFLKFGISDKLKNHQHAVEAAT